MESNENQTESHDAQIEAPYSHCCRCNRYADKCGYDTGGRKPYPHRKAPSPEIGRRLPPDQNSGVGANTTKEGVTDRNLASQTHENVQTQGSNGKAQRSVDKPKPNVVTQEANERDLINDRKIKGHQHEDQQEKTQGDFLGESGHELRLTLIGGIQVRAAPHTRRTSSVPNIP